MTAQTETLNYAPAPAGLGRRRALRYVAVALALVLMTLGVLNYRGLLSLIQQKHRMWSDMRWYDSAASYTAPADRVAWDGSLSTVLGPARPYVVAGAIPPGPGVIFMHERTTNAGHRCLVVIEYSPGRSNVGHHLAATLIERGSLTKHRRHNGPMVALVDDELLRENPPLRLYAGQPDPNDASHFTISYTTATRSGTIDGWLEPPPSGAAAWELGSVRMTRRDDTK